ncbi:hypothetical protein BpHYR1_049019 [Brachionus plicatilis]|uniref:Uncharacterized protein n=1 Tax=Brachionus plicatilis TaxID=10195 RepID=A0A3M7RN11_BRAPC|nr:hypothetical protein BpHYR1_049019 [Brachionus plicatilis]
MCYQNILFKSRTWYFLEFQFFLKLPFFPNVITIVIITHFFKDLKLHILVYVVVYPILRQNRTTVAYSEPNELLRKRNLKSELEAKQATLARNDLDSSCDNGLLFLKNDPLKMGHVQNKLKFIMIINFQSFYIVDNQMEMVKIVRIKNVRVKLSEKKSQNKN